MRLRVVVSTDRAYRVLKRQDMAPLATQVAGEVRTVVQHCGVQLSVTALVADAPSMARAAATGAGALLLLLLPPPPLASSLHQLPPRRFACRSSDKCSDADRPLTLPAIEWACVRLRAGAAALAPRSCTRMPVLPRQTQWAAAAQTLHRRVCGVHPGTRGGGAARGLAAAGRAAAAPAGGRPPPRPHSPPRPTAPSPWRRRRRTAHRALGPSLGFAPPPLPRSLPLHLDPAAPQLSAAPYLTQPPTPAHASTSECPMC
jgi:hypothetical protein